MNRKVSTYLLIGLTLLLIAGSFLPNPAYLSPAELQELQANRPFLLEIGSRYNSQKLGTGYCFGGAAIFLVISATLCSIDRLLGRRGRDESFDSPELPGDIVASATLPPQVTVSATARFVTEWLRRRLLGVEVIPGQTEGDVIIRRGRFGFWGSLLFHSGLISALVAVALYSVGASRGRLVFTEGQHFSLKAANFQYLDKEPPWGMQLPDVELELLKQYSIYAVDDPGTALEHVARFKVTDRKGASFSRDVKINVPLTLEGKDFLLVRGGFSPRFLVYAPDGATAFDSFVNLRNEDGTTDDFAVTTGGLHIAAKLYPDFIRGLVPKTGSQLLKNPFLALTVTKGGRVLFKELVPMGATVRFEGYRVVVPEIRHWVELEMAHEPGLVLFFAVAFLGTLGLLLRMLDPDEQLVVHVYATEGGTVLEFKAQSRHFSALAADVARECAAEAFAHFGHDRDERSLS